MKIWNKYTTGFTGDAPRMPTPDLLGNGEIALNIHKGTESLFFKNDAGEIVRFKRVPDWADIANKPANLWTRDNFNPSNYLPNSGGIITGNIESYNASFVSRQKSTSNYTSCAIWKKDNYGAERYLPQIGQLNVGGSDNSGSITVLPYPTNNNPWDSTVGLFISKNELKFENRQVFHAGNFNPATKAELLHLHDWANINNKPAYLGSTFFSPTANYIGVRTPSRTAGQYYEFWDSNIGWAGIKAKNFQPDGGRANHFLKGDGSLDANIYWHAGNFNPASKADIAHTHDLESYRFKQINFDTSPLDLAHIKIDRTNEEETHMDFTVGDDAGQDDFRFFIKAWDRPTPIKAFEINAWGAVTERLISKRLDVEMWNMRQIGNELCICFNEVIVAKFNPLQGFISMTGVGALGTM